MLLHYNKLIVSWTKVRFFNRITCSSCITQQRDEKNEAKLNTTGFFFSLHASLRPLLLRTNGTMLQERRAQEPTKPREQHCPVRAPHATPMRFSVLALIIMETQVYSCARHTNRYPIPLFSIIFSFFGYKSRVTSALEIFKCPVVSYFFSYFSKKEFQRTYKEECKYICNSIILQLHLKINKKRITYR